MRDYRYRRRRYPENNEKWRSVEDQASYTSCQSQHAGKQIEKQRLILSGVDAKRPHNETAKKPDTADKKHSARECGKYNENHFRYHDNHQPLEEMILLILCKR